MKRVLVTEPIHADGMALLQARPDIEIIQAENAHADTLARLLPGVHGIAVRTATLTADLLAHANDLEVVSRHGVGCDNVDVAHLTARDIPVAIAAGANSTSVAELTMAMILTLPRQLTALDAAVRNGNWQDRANLLATDLEDATMLIVGFGRIGRKVARRARAFGMQVVVADIALDEELAAELGCRGVEDFRAELGKADVVTMHIPLDDTTRHIFSGPELATMKPGALLINCARGGIVAEDALLSSLESGHIGGAGLDVFSQEPPPMDASALAALVSRDDVVLAPHAGAASHGAMRAMATMATQNILDCFDGTLKPDCTFNHEDLMTNAP